MRLQWLVLLALLPLGAGAEAPGPFPDQVSEVLRSVREAAGALRSPEKPLPAAAQEMVLMVLSYNVNGTPLPPKERHERYREVGKLLAKLRREGKGPHIVAIQEAFHPRTRELVEEAGYPHVKAGAPATVEGLLGSGLYILSEFPIEGGETIDYEKCFGWDCYANKGALHVRLRVPGFPDAIDLYDTHLNAGGDEAGQSLKVRIEQIGQLLKFLKKTRGEGSPLVFPADFNFRPGGEDYRLFAEGSGFLNAAEGCARSLQCTGDRDADGIWRDSPDHQFYLSGSQGAGLIPVHLEQTFKEPVNGQPLSDHLGLEVHYRLSR